jgi:hypothetical protein
MNRWFTNTRKKVWTPRNPEEGIVFHCAEPQCDKDVIHVPHRVLFYQRTTKSYVLTCPDGHTHRYEAR